MGLWSHFQGCKPVPSLLCGFFFVKLHLCLQVMGPLINTCIDCRLYQGSTDTGTKWLVSVSQLAESRNVSP